MSATDRTEAPLAVDADPVGDRPGTPEERLVAAGTGGGNGGDGLSPGPDRPGRRPRPVFLLVGLVLAAGLAVGLFTSIGTSSTNAPPHAGGPVPTFSLPELGGSGQVGVDADGGGNGHPAVLVFFAHWCGPCQAEIPVVATTYRREVATGSPLAKVAVIGVDASDPTAAALAFVHKSGVTFPVGADRNFTVTEGKFAFTGLPEVVYVNGNGTIAALHRGPITSAAELRDWQHRLLSGG
ncbi:MAG TPA: TlpA disulfide reductase family protein [Acidimicrobiales bacterium]|nr:TlpA disulfide reductase family protein [Acidimicrobiales bacterium]